MATPGKSTTSDMTMPGKSTSGVTSGSAGSLSRELYERTLTGKSTTSSAAGSLNRELYERTLRYASAESAQDSSGRDAQDAVLDTLPPQEIDPRDTEAPQQLWPSGPSRLSSERRPWSLSQSRKSSAALFDDSGAAGERRNRRLRRAWRWVKRGVLFSILWTGIGLAIMAPAYSDQGARNVHGNDTGHITSEEAWRVAVRLVGGAWVGHIIAALLRVFALVAEGTVFATVIDAADWVALEIICCVLGTFSLIPTS